MILLPTRDPGSLIENVQLGTVPALVTREVLKIGARAHRPTYIPHLPSCPPPTLSPYRHDSDSSDPRSHPRILCWPTATTSCFPRPTSNPRALLRSPGWVQIARGHYPQLYRHHFLMYLGFYAPEHPKSRREMANNRMATCRTYAPCPVRTRSGHRMGAKTTSDCYWACRRTRK